jgi:proteasome-associated ATPase
MARRAAEQTGMAGGMLEEILRSSEGVFPLDERLAFLARLRESGIEQGANIDRAMMERISRLYDALSTVELEHGKLRELIRTLTGPPLFSAVFLAIADTPEVQGALVQTDNERRIVQFGENVVPDELTRGDEVFLNSERNILVAKCDVPILLTGETGTFSRGIEGGRVVVRVHDEEVVVFAREALQSAGLKPGDCVRFSRSAGLAFEKIDPAKGEQYFLENTPAHSFKEIGGLDREIEQLKETLSMHLLHPEKSKLYRMEPKQSALLQGPPGNGKTKLAKAICNWLAGISPGGHARFMNVKPGGLNSMWYGKTENNYREIFRVAREAAAAEPGVPVVMFFDEVDAIATSRGEPGNHIDDKMKNAFFAELDGLEERGNIFVLAATNRIDSLDVAFLRPGRIGDVVLYIPQPNRKAARAILGCHLPADIPYASNGEGQAAAREALLNLAVAQIYAENCETELATLTLRDGKRRTVRAADLISGAQLESIARAAIERACIRDVSGGPGGVSFADMSTAVSDFFAAAARALTPRNARSYLHDLPQDVDVVSVNLVDRKVKRANLYRMEAA